jgi:hypothetical protein
MYKEKAIEIGKNSLQRDPEWDSAIAEAKEQIKRLKSSIKLWESMREKGEKWPGFEVSDGGSSDASAR